MYYSWNEKYEDGIFGYDIELEELKKVLLKAFQEVGLKPNEKLNLDTSDLDKTKNKKIERSNYFER